MHEQVNQSTRPLGLRRTAWLNAHLSCPVDLYEAKVFDYLACAPSALIICFPRL